MASLWDAPLIAGVLPTAVSLAGGLAFLYLLVGRTRRWWTRRVPVGLLAGVAAAAAVGALTVLLRPFPDPLPLRVLAWIAVPVTALVWAWQRRRDGWTHRVLALLAVLAVVATSLVKVNAFYGYRPTIAAALGLPAADQVDLAEVPRGVPQVIAPAQAALVHAWHSPPGMPHTGRMASAAIPGSRSRFPARPAWIYLPPAYLSTPRARLPLLVLIPGQPGGPVDWVLAGNLAAIMDAFAAAHDGLAPVVVVPDVTGSALGNTLCLDSRLGAAETYLADDVPTWLGAHLDVDTSAIAVGGFSFGGTCALQMVVRRPDRYRTFLDVSGQAEPTLGDRNRTVAAAFAGNEDAFRRVNPLDVLRTQRFPTTAGVLVVGRDDTDYRPQAEQVASATRAAGMSVTLREVPGTHSWTLASGALAAALPWIGGRLGLIDPSPPPDAGQAVPRVSAPPPATGHPSG